MVEKRSYQRFNVELRASYRVANTSRISSEVTMMDVSAEGMSFLSADLFDIGQVLEFNVDIDAEEKVSFKTEVMWLAKTGQQYRVGIKIIDGTKSDELKFIRYYCARMMAIKLPKILLVDDERDLVELLKIDLERENYQVVCAYDGEEGYNKYLAESPDLIILDLSMPKMNGRQLCKKIRRETEDRLTPILMLTARNEDSDRIIGRVVGAEKYMTKPFDRQELLDTIKGLIGLGQSRQEGVPHGVQQYDSDRG